MPIARIRSSRRFSFHSASPGVDAYRGSVYFTRPSNSMTTAASSYQASARPMNPAPSWISTCSSGRGSPDARRARRPRVSSGDSARPSERSERPSRLRDADPMGSAEHSPEQLRASRPCVRRAPRPWRRQHRSTPTHGAQSTSVRGTDGAPNPSQGSRSSAAMVAWATRYPRPRRHWSSAVSRTSDEWRHGRISSCRRAAEAWLSTGPRPRLSRTATLVDQVPLALVRRQQMVRAEM